MPAADWEEDDDYMKTKELRQIHDDIEQDRLMQKELLMKWSKYRSRSATLRMEEEIQINAKC